MLFNSIIFIFVFLPLTVILYFTLNKLRLTRVALNLLVVASLFFYTWWKPEYLPVFLGSIIVNYFLGRALGRRVQSEDSPAAATRAILAFGIILNLSALCYYKYTNFLIEIANSLADKPFFLQLDIILPLAISFFTFQQIAYLVDSYKGLTSEYRFSNYALFVSFFPQLIAGPIVHHKEMMPQFASNKAKLVNWHNIYFGLLIFVIGLFKKNFFADNLSIYVDIAFKNSAVFGFFESWLASFAYSFQLYFDFSGYCDMAMGAALMLNIHLPANFNSPYKARNIQDFWRRWHITLSRFLRDYIYIPLGGNRKGSLRTYVNLFSVFLIGGIWHGAGWGFIVWGALHGLGVCCHRLWTKNKIHIPKWPAIIITFLFVNLTWIFFRAETLTQAGNLISAMIGRRGFVYGGIATSEKLVFMLLLSFAVMYLLPNSVQFLQSRRKESVWAAVGIGVLISILILNKTTISKFIYFNF